MAKDLVIVESPGGILLGRRAGRPGPGLRNVPRAGERQGPGVSDTLPASVMFGAVTVTGCAVVVKPVAATSSV